MPIVIEASQWFANGDHPGDRLGEELHDPLTGTTFSRTEGKVVRFFRRPEAEYSGDKIHEACKRQWHDHGWIDTLEGDHIVCPGDWIITGVQKEVYPCKPDIFAATYELVEDWT